MDPEGSGTIKKIIVEAPSELHGKFKAAAYSEGRTIKEIILEFLGDFVEDREKNKAKGKK